MKNALFQTFTLICLRNFLPKCKIFEETHLFVGTFVSDKKLFRTERNEASICANGVTMRSSP